MAKPPRAGTIRRRIHDMLPATNAEIGDALEMNGLKVARTLAAMIDAGLALNANPGRGRIARYEAA